ncbi:hypothetical protein [Massilia suwonensis]|uniref:Flagellar hook-length control protein FliK n=1 Tax=Massilia suwonensis TaxID=648895 RepID=A0ABW0MF83_9BURK
MNPLSLSAPLLPPTVPPLQVGAVMPVGAAAAVAYAAAEAELPLPVSQPLPASQPTPGAAQHTDGAAMRPDQVFMSRQMVFGPQDARSLAGNWRAMVGNYGAGLIERALRERTGALAPALLLAGQEGRTQGRAPEGQLPADAWRFTVHAGSAQAQHLQVLRQGPDGGSGRRRQPRAALRLELELADGTHVALQVEPMPGGVAIEVAAPDAAALARLRALQPQLDAAVERAGLIVVRWSFRAGIVPAGSAHALLAAEDVGDVLTLPVFRAVAELALMLPAQG